MSNAKVKHHSTNLESGDPLPVHNFCTHFVTLAIRDMTWWIYDKKPLLFWLFYMQMKSTVLVYVHPLEDTALISSHPVSRRNFFDCWLTSLKTLRLTTLSPNPRFPGGRIHSLASIRHRPGFSTWCQRVLNLKWIAVRASEHFLEFLSFYALTNLFIEYASPVGGHLGWCFDLHFHHV